MVSKMINSEDPQICEAGLFLVQGLFIKMCLGEPELTKAYLSEFIQKVCEFLKHPLIYVRFTAFQAICNIV